MEMITILKLNFKFNHTIDITGVAYQPRYNIFRLNSPSFNVYLRSIYPSQLAVTNFRKTLSFYSVRFLVCTLQLPQKIEMSLTKLLSGRKRGSVSSAYGG